jgi:hypothetical protein
MMRHYVGNQTRLPELSQARGAIRAWPRLLDPSSTPHQGQGVGALPRWRAPWTRQRAKLELDPPRNVMERDLRSNIIKSKLQPTKH